MFRREESKKGGEQNIVYVHCSNYCIYPYINLSIYQFIHIQLMQTQAGNLIILPLSYLPTMT